ncbi:MAG: hypothetical protein WD602_05130 [Actinomycetota bacterium]
MLRRAAVLSIVAALVHGLNISEHLREWWGYGLFFMFAAVVQFIYGLIMLIQPWNYDPSGARRDGSSFARPYYLVGIALNIPLIALYLVTRTLGIPLLGPEAGEVEAFSFAGILTIVVEAALVATLAALVRRPKVLDH